MPIRRATVRRQGTVHRRTEHRQVTHRHDQGPAIRMALLQLLGLLALQQDISRQGRLQE